MAKHRKIFTTCTVGELKFVKYDRADTIVRNVNALYKLAIKLLTVALKSLTFFHHFINIIPISLDSTLSLVVIFALYILDIVILSLFLTSVSPWHSYICAVLLGFCASFVVRCIIAALIALLLSISTTLKPGVARTLHSSCNTCTSLA